MSIPRTTGNTVIRTVSPKQTSDNLLPNTEEEKGKGKTITFFEHLQSE